MREFLRGCIAVVCVGAILVAIAVFCGFTPEGLLYGQWPSTDEHATNSADIALHPTD